MSPAPSSVTEGAGAPPLPPFPWTHVALTVADVEEAIEAMSRLLVAARGQQKAAVRGIRNAIGWSSGTEEAVEEAMPSLYALPYSLRLLTYLHAVAGCLERCECGPLTAPQEELGPWHALNEQERAVWARLLQLHQAPVCLGRGPNGDFLVQGVELWNEEAGIRGARALAWFETNGAGAFIRFFDTGREPSDGLPLSGPSPASDFLRSIGLTHADLGPQTPIPAGERALIIIHPTRLGEALRLTQVQAALLRPLVCWDYMNPLLAALQGGPLVNRRVQDWDQLLHRRLPGAPEWWLVPV